MGVTGAMPDLLAENSVKSLSLSGPDLTVSGCSFSTRPPSSAGPDFRAGIVAPFATISPILEATWLWWPDCLIHTFLSGHYLAFWVFDFLISNLDLDEWANPGLFCLFWFYSNTIIHKNCRLQWDSNTDRRSRMEVRWPLDHHHRVPNVLFKISVFCSRLVPDPDGKRFRDRGLRKVKTKTQQRTLFPL